MRQQIDYPSAGSYTAIITADLLAGYTIIASEGCIITVDTVQVILPHTLAVGEQLAVTHIPESGVLSNLRLLTPDDGVTSGGTALDTEAVQDIVGTMLQATGASWAYNDTAGTMTLTVPQGLTQEQIEDISANLIKAGSNVTVTYDDAAGTLTINGQAGTGGSVLPAGGTVGQVLTKTGTADGAAGWQTPSASGGGSGPAVGTVLSGPVIGRNPSALSRAAGQARRGAGLLATVTAGLVTSSGTGTVQLAGGGVTCGSVAFDAPDHFAKDPCILKVGGTYYVYYTGVGSGNYGIGLASGPSLDALTYVSTFTFARRSWAPCVVPFGGRYYLFAGDTTGTFRVDSDSPAGPWGNLTAVSGDHFDPEVVQIGGQWYMYAAPTTNGRIDVAPMADPTSTNLTWTNVLTLDNAADGIVNTEQVLEAPSVVTLSDGRTLLYYSPGNSDQPYAPMVAELVTPTQAVRLGQVSVERLASGATSHLSVLNDGGVLRMMLCANGGPGQGDFKLLAYTGGPYSWTLTGATPGVPANVAEGLIYAQMDGTLRASAAPPTGPHLPLAAFVSSGNAITSLTDARPRTWAALGQSDNPSTNSGALTLVPDMQIVAYTSGGPLLVSAFINVLNESGTSSYNDVMLYVDGQPWASGGDMSSQSQSGAAATSFSHTYVLDLPAGRHVLEMRWGVQFGPLRSVQRRRSLYAAEQ